MARTGRSTRKRPARKVTGRKPNSIIALRESEARFRSLTHLSSDWYWEQDAQYRFTRIEGRNISPTAPSLIGITRWESRLEIEGGWDRHRALLDAHKPFYDLVMWRIEDGRRRFIQVSGEPLFSQDGRFIGYRGVGRDITAQKRAERLLRLEHQVARALSESTDADIGIEAVLHAVCETEGWRCGRYFAVDEAGGQARFRSGWAVSDPAAKKLIESSNGLSFRPGYDLVGKVLQAGDPQWSDEAFAFAVTAEGRRIGVLAFDHPPMLEPDERLLQAARIIGSQVGQFLKRMAAETALRESEARFRSLTQMSSDFFWETDEHHRFTQVSHGKNFDERYASAIIGKTAWEVPYTMPDEQGWARLRETIEAHQPYRDFEFGRPARGGGVRYFTVSGEPRFDAAGRFLGHRGVGRDITDVVLARQHISSLAYNDALTGLANRTSLVPAFEQAVERARRRNARLAALFIDLDGFKQVNDAWGHAAGDLFLGEIGRRLRAGLRASDLVARLGGDEFFAVLEEVQDAGQVEATARKLLADVSRPVEIFAGTHAAVTASVGISMFPQDAPDVATLIKYADRAMYEAKQSGKNALRFYSDNLPTFARSRAGNAAD